MNCWPSGKYVHLLYMHSILGRGSFCFNYCHNSAWHGGDQVVALQATWAMSFSTLPPDSRTLVSWNTKLALIWKEEFGPLGNSPVLLLSPGKTPLTTTVAKFLDTSVCGGSWCLDPSLSSFLVKFTQTLESILLDNPHKAAVLSVDCASFSSTLFPSTQLSVNMLGYSTLNSHLLWQWMFLAYPPCEGCQWLSSGQLSDQQSSPWLCSLWTIPRDHNQP